ncbi:MAG: glycosyltransferase family 4 protein [bacterium]|nr:glycosyltransferase family 4 protein [bacterium]
MKTINKPKIAVIGLKGLPAFGGAATVGEKIIEQLKDKYDFTVYSTSSHTQRKTGDYNGYKQIVLKSFFIKKLTIPYYYFMSAIKTVFINYDLVHLHHSDWSIIIPLIKLRHKVILTSHGSPMRIVNNNFKYGKKEESLVKFSERKFLKYADTVTCVSKVLTEYLKELYRKDIVYIPNGISLEMIDKNTKVHDVCDKDYILFTAARIIPTKGCHILFKALNKIAYKEKVIVIGDLEQIPEYKNELLELSKDLNVEYKGLIKEKKILLEYLMQAKYFVFTSSFEAMSMMLLEAASVKTPVICSDIPENTTVFNENEVLYFKTDDVDDLANKIILAENDPIKLKMMAENAYKNLSNNYNWEKISKMYDEEYKILINKNI